MGIKLNFSGVETWEAGGGPLDPGVYHGTITGCELGKTSNSNPNVRVEVTLDPDPDRGVGPKGRKVNDFYVLAVEGDAEKSAKVLGKFKGLLSRLEYEDDLDGEVDFEPGEIIGAACQVRLGPPDDRSKGFNTVLGIHGPDAELN